ncbi:MAG: hypothetical protein J6T10_24135 [Methanobrevibacter sp.]|nr:hypothetical protein [Methanobrevibacter sp.]
MKAFYSEVANSRTNNDERWQLYQFIISNIVSERLVRFSCEVNGYTMAQLKKIVKSMTGQTVAGFCRSNGLRLPDFMKK